MATKTKKNAKQNKGKATAKRVKPPEPKPSGPAQFRQGDVMLMQTDKVPEGAMMLNHCNVAQGTATGHSHRFDAGAVQFRTEAGDQFIEVIGDVADLVHEEHATINVPGPAIYRVVHQREFTGEDARAVQD